MVGGSAELAALRVEKHVAYLRRSLLVGFDTGGNLAGVSGRTYVGE